MANRGITRNDVFRAASALADRGVKPSITEIREWLGTGSLSTISRFLKDWRHDFSDGETHLNELGRVPATIPAAREATDEELNAVLLKEHPQVSALILSKLTPDRCAKLLSTFPMEIRTAMTSRIASMRAVAPEILNRINRVLKNELEDLRERKRTWNGAAFIAEVANLMKEPIKRDLKTLRRGGR